jgi:hypothetical protein
MTSFRDSCGNIFGHSFTTLEAVSLLVFLSTIPNSCANRSLLFLVDNLPLTYAFRKRYAKQDPETSLNLRSFLSFSFLSCDPHICFLPLCSTPLFNPVHYLSRQTTPPHPLPNSYPTLNLFFSSSSILLARKPHTRLALYPSVCWMTSAPLLSSPLLSDSSII